MDAHRVAKAGAAGVLYFFAFVTISASHFAVWDVMEEVPSTTTLAIWLRGAMAPLAILILGTSLAAGFVTARHPSRVPLLALLGGGSLALLTAMATIGRADDRIYPLTGSSVDVVTTHSLVLIAVLVFVPVGTLVASRQRRFSS